MRVKIVKLEFDTEHEESHSASFAAALANDYIGRVFTVNDDDQELVDYISDKTGYLVKTIGYLEI